jgi:hypothetical protein
MEALDAAPLPSSWGALERVLGENDGVNLGRSAALLRERHAFPKRDAQPKPHKDSPPLITG